MRESIKKSIQDISAFNFVVRKKDVPERTRSSAIETLKKEIKEPQNNIKKIKQRLAEIKDENIHGEKQAAYKISDLMLRINKLEEAINKIGKK